MTVSTEIRLTGRGTVSMAMREYAREKVGRVISTSGRPVLDAHVELTQESDPARRRPAIAAAGLDIAGTPVRGQVAAAGMREAIDLLVDVLRRRLQQLTDRAKARSNWIWYATGEAAGHGSQPAQRPEYRQRPLEQRAVVRRATAALCPTTVDEAAYDMDLLGHRFYLFTDRATGREAVVHRLLDGSFAVLGPAAADDADGAGGALRRTVPVVVRTEAQAIQHLDLAGEPFVFYLDTETGRGHVVYRRYDGNYGVIVPA